MEKVLSMLKATSESSRLRLLILCASGEFTVSDLMQIIGQSQPGVSRNLKILCDAGLLRRIRQGSWVFYRSVTKGAEAEFVHYLTTVMPATDPTIQLDRQRLLELKNERLRAAAQYFEKTAAEWDSIRTLHVEDLDIERTLKTRVLEAKPRTLLDIGTGTGRILEILGPYVEDAEGVDFSHEMLTVARANLDKPSLRHCRVRHSNMYQLPYQDRSFHFITIHHVLHFAHQPQQVLKEAARVLRTQGQMVIVDFASHVREELRTKFKHQRLGFSNDEMEGWLHKIGLSIQPPTKFTGESLAVMIWTGIRDH